MTKAIKKTLLAILAFGLVIASAFSLATLRTAFADTDDLDDFIANTNAFVALADQGTGQEDPDGVLTEAEIEAVIGKTTTDDAAKTADTYFFAMYNFISNDSGDATGDAYLAAKAVYDQVFAVYNKTLITDSESGETYGVVDLYSNLRSTVYQIYTAVGHSYSKDKDSATIYRAIFDYIVANVENSEPEVNTKNKLAFLKNSDLEWVDTNEDDVKDTPEILVLAENQIQTWADNIDNAITKIKAIEIIEDETANETIVVWNESESEYREVYKKVTEIVGDDEVEVITNNVVLASRATIEVARAAVNTVIAQGDVSCINGTYQYDGTDTNHLKVLTDAETGLKAQTDKVAAVEKAIKTVFAEYCEDAGKEVCYTIKDKILAAKESYEALDDNDYNKDETPDSLNDLQSAVNTDIKTNLDTMLATLDDVDTAITFVEAQIDAIGTVEYTAASKANIKAARDAFDALPNDVKVNDNAKFDAEAAEEEYEADYCVENYVTLKTAEAKWAKYVKEVETLIAAIKDLRDIELNTPLTIYSKANAAQVLYNSLSDRDNQLQGDAENDIIGVRSAALDESFLPAGQVAEKTNCGEAYDYYINLLNVINSSVKQIRLDIKSLYELYDGEVRFTLDFDSLYTRIKGAIDALPKIGEGSEKELDPRYKGAIDNYDKYEELTAKYEELIDLANAWVEKVKAIGTVSVNTFDKVDEAIEAYNNLKEKYPVDNADPVTFTLEDDLAAFEVALKIEKANEEETNNEEVNEEEEAEEEIYSDFYTDYADAVSKKDEIIGKLDAVKAAADDLDRPGTIGTPRSRSLPENIVEYDYNEYKTAVENVTALLGALETYDDTSVEGYIATAKYFETYAGDDDDTAEGYVYSYAKYEVALIYVKADVIEIAIYKITANSTENVNYIARARSAYDDYKDKTDGKKVQDAVRNLENLTDEEEKLSNWIAGVAALLTGAAFDGSDATAPTSVVTINSDEQLKAGVYKVDLDKADDLLDDYGDFTNVEKAYTGVSDAISTASKVYAIAGKDEDQLGKKLAYIDKELKEYVTSYNNGTPTQGRYEELVEILDNLHSTQKGLLTNANAFEQIARDNEMAIELAKAIVNLYADVRVEVDAKTVVEYNIISSIYKSLNDSQKVLVDTNVATLNGDDGEASLDKIGETIENGGAPYNTGDAIANAIAAAKAELEAAIATAKDQAIADAASKDADIITAYVAAIAALDDAYKAADDAITTAYEAAIATAKTELEDAIASATDELKGLIDAAKDYADGKDSEMATAITAAYEDAIAAAKTELETAIAAAKTELNEKINDLKTALEAKDAELEQAIADAIADYTQKINDLKTALEAKDAELEQAIADAIADYTQKINELKTALEAKDAELEQAIADAIADYTQKINELKTALEAKDAELEQAIADAIADYTQKINELKTALEAKDTALDAKDAELEQAIADAIADYTQKINELKTALEAKDTALDAKDAEFEQAIADAIADYIQKINAEKEAKDTAVADLQSQIDALNSKTTVTIIVFAIICGALCACVVVLFVLRKRG